MSFKECRVLQNWTAFTSLEEESGWPLQHSGQQRLTSATQSFCSGKVHAISAADGGSSPLQFSQAEMVSCARMSMKAGSWQKLFKAYLIWLSGKRPHSGGWWGGGGRKNSWTAEPEAGDTDRTRRISHKGLGNHKGDGHMIHTSIDHPPIIIQRTTM